MNQSGSASSPTVEDTVNLSTELPDRGKFAAIRQRLVMIWRSGDLPYLVDRPIVWRFGTLMAIGFVSVLIFGGFYGIGEALISKAVREQAAFGELRDGAADFRADLLAMQTALTGFIDQQNPAMEKQLRQTAERAAGTLKTMQASQAASGNAEVLQALQDGLSAALTDFDKVAQAEKTLGMSDFEGLRFKLNASIKAMQSELDIWPNQDPLVARMLQMRLAEKDFLLTKEPGVLGRHKRWANEVDLKIDSGGLDPNTRANFHKLLEAYLADWAAYGETSLVISQGAGSMRKIFNGLQPKVDGLFDSAEASSRHATMATIDIRHAMLWRTMAMGVISALAFQIFGMIFSRSITVPIAAMERSMRKLAAGDRNAEISGIGRKDEIGDMAEAVKVFKDNIVAMEQLQVERAAQSEALAEKGRHLERLTAEFDREATEIMRAVEHSMDALHERAESITELARLTSEQMVEIDHSSRQATEGVRCVGNLGDASTRHQQSGQRFLGGHQRGHRSGDAHGIADDRAVRCGAKHWRRGGADHLDRAQDAYAGTQRHHRIGARRRGRQGLRRGGAGGQGPVDPDLGRNRTDLEPYRRHPGQDRPGGRRHQPDRRHHEQDPRQFRQDHRGGGSAAIGDARHRRQCRQRRRRLGRRVRKDQLGGPSGQRNGPGGAGHAEGVGGDFATRRSAARQSRGIPG